MNYCLYLYSVTVHFKREKNYGQYINYLCSMLIYDYYQLSDCRSENKLAAWLEKE